MAGVHGTHAERREIGGLILHFWSSLLNRAVK